MNGSRLFHTIVIVGAALAAATAIGCSGDDGGPSTTPGSTTGADTTSAAPAGGDAGPSADVDGGADPGWAPTK